MQPNNSLGSSASSSSSSSENSDTEDENSSLWRDQHWRSAKNMSHLRERLDVNVAFHAAASQSIEKARNEMLGRFLNQVWDEKKFQVGYTADKSEQLDFVKILSSFDSSLGEFLEVSYDKSDVFTSTRSKQQYARPLSMNEYLKTHCCSSAYMFEVKASLADISQRGNCHGS